MSNEILDAKLKVWDRTIEVQQHFNDIEITIRNYALTLFTAIIAGIGYLLEKRIDIVFHHYIIPSSSIAALIGVLIMCSFYYMDKYWYHKLLKGAVVHAVHMEGAIKADIPEIILTSTIGDYSPMKIFHWTFKSEKKYYFFYYPLIIVFVLLYFFLLAWA